jgi:hypothetical protein
MTRNMTMTFSRDVGTSPSCLEYSWVPTGARRHILLDAGSPEGSETDAFADDYYPSQVQVYVLCDGNQSAMGWQFPSGPPRGKVVGASVTVSHQQKQVVGKVWFVDGSTAAEERKLDQFARKCPEPQS